MTRYDGYLINGVRFHTQKRDSTRCVQNSGVTLTSKTMQVSSSSEVKEDEDGCKLVDLTKIEHKSDSFILSTHAQQVFYVEDGNVQLGRL